MKLHTAGGSYLEAVLYFKRSSVWCVKWMLLGMGFQNLSVCIAVGTLRGAVFDRRKPLLHATDLGRDAWHRKIYERHCFLLSTYNTLELI